jgi:hypothetical protein
MIRSLATKRGTTIAPKSKTWGAERRVRVGRE